MKILLICAVGMSTSLIVKKMQEIAPEGIQIKADASSNLNEIIDGYDVVLIGPQIRFRETQIREIAKDKNIAVGLIEPIWYGRLMVKEILEYALDLGKERG
ncbi:PTS sugar transporter subunit IIB [Patescibacteria group bacterium]|nr:PTS sugar transporter subunit IIB [Patescibacteria group bacterium]